MIMREKILKLGHTPGHTSDPPGHSSCLVTRWKKVTRNPNDPVPCLAVTVSRAITSDCLTLYTHVFYLDFVVVNLLFV